MEYKKILLISIILAAIMVIAIDGQTFNKKLFEVAKDLSFTLFIVQHFAKQIGGIMRSIAKEVRKIIAWHRRCKFR